MTTDKGLRATQWLALAEKMRDLALAASDIEANARRTLKAATGVREAACDCAEQFERFARDECAPTDAVQKYFGDLLN
jgi:hypothetical protein